MISDTLSVGLQQYRIGPKLRGLRLKKKLGLVEPGRHTSAVAVRQTGRARAACADAIACALAYGWVDGQLGSIDAHYLKTRFSPAAAQKCLVPNRSLRSRTSGAGRSHAFSGASAS